MVIVKQFVGKFENESSTTCYYLVKQNAYYGIELLEEKDHTLTSTIEWFTEDEKEAYDLTSLFYTHGVSSIHLGALLDNYIS